MTKDKDPFIGEIFESKDWRDSGRRVRPVEKIEKRKRYTDEVYPAYICVLVDRFGNEHRNYPKTTIGAAGLKKRWRKVSH